MALTLMRHTRPLISEGVCYGSLDIDVADDFEVAAKAALAEISPPNEIVTSPMKRCLQLAKVARACFGIDYSVTPDLREMDFGRWEGVHWSDIPRNELDHWAADFMDATPHGGESVRIFQKRVTLALEQLAQVKQSTLVITHAGVLKIACVLQGDKDAWDKKHAFGSTINYGA